MGIEAQAWNQHEIKDPMDDLLCIGDFAGFHFFGHGLYPGLNGFIQLIVSPEINTLEDKKATQKKSYKTIYPDPIKMRRLLRLF